MDALYNRIGSGYDTTRRPDPFIAGRLRALLSPRPGGRYVDIACGSGNYTLALANAGVPMTGVDISARMIAAARAKPAPASLDHWVQAQVAAMPFAGGAFAGAVCSLAIHHFPDLPAAFAEISRIVDARDGRLVIFTATPGQMRHYWLGRYFPAMLERSISQMPSPESVKRALGEAGFRQVTTENYHVSPTLRDLFLYSGKQRPELYLDAGVRAGISSFSSLGDRGEIEAGLARLAADIESGAIAAIIDAATHSEGDYLFIRAGR